MEKQRNLELWINLANKVLERRATNNGREDESYSALTTRSLILALELIEGERESSPSLKRNEPIERPVIVNFERAKAEMNSRCVSSSRSYSSRVVDGSLRPQLRVFRGE